jgi:hypothetical protein
MQTLPRPKHYGQNWLEMTPTIGGRVCGQCEKTIVDFSKRKWEEIEALQIQNNYSICGMYSQNQLANWGKESKTLSCTKIVSTTSLILALGSTFPTNGQGLVKEVSKPRTVVNGKISGISKEGIIKKIGFATVSLKNTNISVSADSNGAFQL